MFSNQFLKKDSILEIILQNFDFFGLIVPIFQKKPQNFKWINRESNSGHLRGIRPKRNALDRSSILVIHHKNKKIFFFIIGI